MPEVIPRVSLSLEEVIEFETTLFVMSLRIEVPPVHPSSVKEQEALF
jgi:hypothetical protein